MNMLSQISRKVGMSPGTVVHVGDQSNRPVGINLVEYGKDGVTETTFEQFDELVAACQQTRPAVRWIDFDGVHDAPLLEAVGQHFGLHPLLVEDIANTSQRAKLEVEENRLFLVMRHFDFNGPTMESEQICLLLQDGLVLSFREREQHPFKAVLNRIRLQKSRLRQRAADYLFYALIDTFVDQSLVVTEQIADLLDNMEDSVFDNPDQEIYEDMTSLRRQMAQYRKGTTPMLTMSARLSREELPLISPTTRRYFVDVHDHVVALLESMEMQRESLMAVHDAYQTFMSNRMNETMRVLTVIATIFIPLTFLAGIYGMNFIHMPELDRPYSYPLLLALMLLIALLMLVYFRRRRWL